MARVPELSARTMECLRAGLAALALISIVACAPRGAPADRPTDVAAVAGDSSVTVTWTMVPDVEYWIFYAPAASISKDDWFMIPGTRVLKPASSPTLVGGLVNGARYSFMIDGRYRDGPGGDASASVSAVPRLAGVLWTAGGSIGAQDLRAATFGAKFVVAGSAGTLASGSDGSSWTPLISGVVNTLNAALYTANLYLAAGTGGTLLRSTDALTWTSATSAATADLHALASNGGALHIAVGDAGTLLYSSDGQNWSLAASSSTATQNALYGAAYGANGFAAVGAGGTILTSTDGTNWIASSSGTSADLKSVAYAAGLYVAVGAGGAVVTSTDAATWTVQTALPLPAGAAALNSVIYLRQLVAVGDGGAIYTSRDGISWLAQNSGTTQNLFHVTGSPYGYLAVGAAGTNLVSY